MVVIVPRIVSLVHVLRFLAALQSVTGITTEPCQGGKCVEHTASPTLSCPEGYYGPNCAYKCSDSCIGSQCEISKSGVGICTKGCVKGYWGRSCAAQCSQVCDGCNRGTGVCIACKPSAKCEDNCQELCPHSDCNCTNIEEPCLHGKFGSNCQWGCSEFCKGNVCSRKFGHCISGCKKGYFGSKCENRCNINCRLEKCTIDGDCSSGCNPRFYGDFCELMCSENCRLNACDRHVGDCTSGCADGYFGPRCNRTCPGCEVCDGRTGICLGAGAEPKNGSHLILISSTVSVSIILLVAVIIIVLQYRSKKSSTQQYLIAVAPVTLQSSVNSTYNEAYDGINEQAEVMQHLTPAATWDGAFLTLPTPNMYQQRGINEQSEVLGYSSTSTPTNLDRNFKTDQNQSRAFFHTL